MTKSKTPSRTVSALTSRQLATVVGGISEDMQQLDWIASVVDRGNTIGGGLLGAKSLILGGAAGAGSLA